MADRLQNLWTVASRAAFLGAKPRDLKEAKALLDE
jgi:hypothetical protein